MSDIVPTPEDSTRTTVTLPDRIWGELERLVEETVTPKGKPAYTRDQLMTFLLDWAIKEHDKRQGEKKVKR